MNQELEHLLFINTTVLAYFRDELQKSEEALEYLSSRHVDKETVEVFKLGYAPGDSTYEWALCHRVIFPFIDIYSNILGFSGRLIKEENQEEPKYRNSRESPIFQKSRILYGLFQTYEEIEKQGFAYLVEGQFDVLRLYQTGIKNVVGLSGSSFTEDQARLLCRYINKVVVVLDSDEAGEKSSINVIKILQKMKIETKRIILPVCGADPDSFVLNNGKEKFLNLKEE